MAVGPKLDVLFSQHHGHPCGHMESHQMIAMTELHLSYHTASHTLQNTPLEGHKGATLRQPLQHEEHNLGFL